MVPDFAFHVSPVDDTTSAFDPCPSDSSFDPGQESPPILEIRGLQRSFGKVPAVNDVNLTAYEGEIYGFLGINGAGKTTTIRLIMGILAAQAGTITLLGETTSRTSVAQKQRIGYVSQDQNFYPWMTCKALGRFVGAFYPTWDAAEFTRLLEIFEIPPERRSSELSGGMRAKLALALALAPRPSLLVLDEPTAGMDPVARREFMQIIIAQARQYRRTTFFSSHLIDEVERCADRVGIIHKGSMRFEGKLRDLRDRVRKIHIPAGADFCLPPQFEIWQDQELAGTRELTLNAMPDAWNTMLLPEALTISRLSLEEIFIACVGSRNLKL